MIMGHDENDERSRLRAALRSITDYLETLLDEGKFPGKGRSEDDKDSTFGWWENRWTAVRRAQDLLAACETADREAIRLHQQSLTREEEARKARIEEGMAQVRAALKKKEQGNVADRPRSGRTRS
jgi:hypothetical protein